MSWAAVVITQSRKGKQIQCLASTDSGKARLGFLVWILVVCLLIRCTRGTGSRGATQKDQKKKPRGTRNQSNADSNLNFSTWFPCHLFRALWSQGCVIYHTEFSPLGAQAAKEASVGTGTSSSWETLNQQTPYACANQSTSVRLKKKKTLRAHTVPLWIVPETQDNVQLSIWKMTNKSGQ